MKERIVTNIRETDVACTANGKQTPLPPANLADHLGRLVPEPPVDVVEPTTPPPIATAAPTADQTPPPTTP